jgi:hypothetical protein
MESIGERGVGQAETSVATAVNDMPVVGQFAS